MKKPDALKKLFSWSSESTRDVLGGILKCFASATKRTESSFIEEALSRMFLPTNHTAKTIVISMFQGNALALGYSMVFRYLAAGANGIDAAAPNGKPLVLAFRDMAFIQTARYHPEKDNGDIKYIASKFGSIADYVSTHDPQTGCYMSDLIDEMTNAPEYFNYFNLISALLSSWDLVGNKSLTYRVLAAMIRMCPDWVDDTEANRCNFIQILSEVSADWWSRF